MAELNKIRFLLFVSLMIFPACALDVILSGAHQEFKQKSEIDIDIVDGEKIYRGTLNQLTYEAELGISKVIVYIISRSRCIEILRPAGVAREIRSQIARELRETHCELLFLGIENIDDDEYHLIGAFIFNKIRRHPDQKDFHIKTIGENRFDEIFRCSVRIFEKYRENAQICGGTLLARLRSIPHGALKPIGSNGKEIKLCGFKPVVKEVTWSVSLRNNTYVPQVEPSDPTYNFIKDYRKKKICLLILSGKEYLAVSSYGKRGSQRAATIEFMDGMKKNREVLIILGVFNFDWTEVDIVTQIILKHSVGSQRSVYNVFTCGYGMFNTYYSYKNAGGERYIRRQPHSNVSEVIKVLMGGEAKERAINVHYHYDDEWKVSNMTINLSNGRYAPEVRFKNFTLSSKLPYRKIAFIVYDPIEINDPIDVSAVVQSVEELKQSDINVVFIEAINFGLDDMHIIAEWIDRHSGDINSEQIAVLGGGIFDTIFQSESTTYNTFLNTKKNELKAIRNAYVKTDNGKSVSATVINESAKFVVWSYSMNTVVNGCYEPDLIPDLNMFSTIARKKIFFIITSAYNFRQIAAIKNVRLLIAGFRRKINQFYPDWKWRVFLVGLDNFEERDSHLFAELVEKQTNVNCLREFVRIFNCGMRPAVYQYKDSEPFENDTLHSSMQEHFTHFFGIHMTLV